MGSLGLSGKNNREIFSIETSSKGMNEIFPNYEKYHYHVSNALKYTIEDLDLTIQGIDESDIYLFEEAIVKLELSDAEHGKAPVCALLLMFCYKHESPHKGRLQLDQVQRLRL